MSHLEQLAYGRWQMECKCKHTNSPNSNTPSFKSWKSHRASNNTVYTKSNSDSVASLKAKKAKIIHSNDDTAEEWASPPDRRSLATIGSEHRSVASHRRSVDSDRRSVASDRRSLSKLSVVTTASETDSQARGKGK